ncbi:MAG: hypothetical protein LLF98_06105 [Clostridium sp.]|nr:hypothetical protein [Clostridium sp.]
MELFQKHSENVFFSPGRVNLIYFFKR